MSQSNVATLPLVIPLYEYMKSNLEATIRDVTVKANIREACKHGYEKLLKYYYPAINCQLNIIATSKLPCSYLCNFCADTEGKC